MHIRPWIAGLLFALQTIGGSTQRSGADRIITCTPPAPPSFARGDDMVRGAIPLTPENIILAGNGRLFTPCESTSEYGALPRYVAEASLLGSGLRSTDPRLRRLTAIAWGQIGALINSPLLADPDPSVRIASADGFANELLGITSDLTSLATLPINGRARAVTPLQISNGRATLETAARRERVDQVAAVILESLGRLRLEEADAARTEPTGLPSSSSDATSRWRRSTATGARASGSAPLGT